MNADLEKVVNSVLINGEISERSRELLMKKAEQLGVDLIDLELELESRISQDSAIYFKRNPSKFKNSEIEIKETFGFPLWLIWLINAIAWMLFFTTDSHPIEIITGLCCTICIFLALKHYRIKTPALFNLWFLSPGYLLYMSAIDAIWMFAWGFGLFEDFF